MKKLIISILLFTSTICVAEDLTKKDKVEWNAEIDKAIMTLARLKTCVKKVKRKVDLEPCGVKNIRSLLKLNSPDNPLIIEINKH
jgi:hypothetical protein